MLLLSDRLELVLVVRLDYPELLLFLPKSCLDLLVLVLYVSVLEGKLFVLLLELTLQREVFAGNLYGLAFFDLLFQHGDLRVVVCLLNQYLVLFLLEILDCLLGICDTALVLL